jgi:hypothetical protein
LFAAKNVEISHGQPSIKIKVSRPTRIFQCLRGRYEQGKLSRQDRLFNGYNSYLSFSVCTATGYKRNSKLKIFAIQGYITRDECRNKFCKQDQTTPLFVFDGDDFDKFTDGAAVYCL